MIKKLTFLLAFVTLACGTSQTALSPQSVVLTGACPISANCALELLPNQRMIITGDASGLQYRLTAQPGTHVLRYKYDKIVKGNLQDAGYREELLFEIPAAGPVDLKADGFGQTNMLFGRFCYCKGQTGYYRVSNGQLSIDKNGTGQLNFTILEVPQITNAISFSLQ